MHRDAWNICACGWMVFPLSSVLSFWGLLCLKCGLCVWQMWQCVKSGQVCCCRFVGEICGRYRFLC